MSFKYLQWLTTLLPPLLIGGFEYARHDLLYSYIPMETGNLYITLLTFVLSFFFSAWVFRVIKRMNQKIADEQARRAVYEERERLASDLHDGIAQTLFYLNIKLKQGEIEEARTAVSKIENQVRQAIFNLRSSPEKQEDFTHRLDKWLSQWSSLTGIEVIQDIHLTENFFPKTDEVLLFGIIQEAFSNIRKHANATLVKIRFAAQQSGGWELVIQDNGIGIRLPDTPIRKYGMSMIQERAEKLSADFSIENVQPKGTKLKLVFHQTEAKV